MRLFATFIRQRTFDTIEVIFPTAKRSTPLKSYSKESVIKSTGQSGLMFFTSGYHTQIKITYMNSFLLIKLEIPPLLSLSLSVFVDSITAGKKVEFESVWSIAGDFHRNQGS
ncbi:hypothetical protein YC2023_065744 [Brassica napus]